MRETPKAYLPHIGKIDKDTTMDNLQETSIYLAALLDGEGYVQLTEMKKPKGKCRLFAALSFANTDVRIVEQMRRALSAFGIHYHVYESTRNVLKGGKPDLTVGVHRLTQVRALLEVVLSSPFLSKRRECELLLEFVNSRIGPDGKPWPRGGKGAIRSVPYKERDFEIMREISMYGCHKLKTPQRAYVQTQKTCSELPVRAGELDGNVQAAVSAA